MKKIVNLIENFVDKLSRRERLLVLLGIISILYLIWDTVLITPIQAKHKNLVSERLSIQRQLSELEVRNILASSLLKKNNNDVFDKQLKQIKIKVKGLDKIIEEQLQDKVPAELMATMLNDVLQKNNNLTLLRIHNLPAKPLIDSDAKAGQKNNTKDIKKEVKKEFNGLGIFMHPLELELEGTYLEILDYLLQLEALKWRIFWDEVELKVLQHPKVKVKIKVHTFGLKDGWLSV